MRVLKNSVKKFDKLSVQKLNQIINFSGPFNTFVTLTLLKIENSYVFRLLNKINKNKKTLYFANTLVGIHSHYKRTSLRKKNVET